MSYNVLAKPWKGGWELHITGVGVTQSRTLPTAEQAARDYIATLYDLDEVTDPIEVTVGLGEEVKAKIAKVKVENRNAEAAMKAAAEKYRAVVRQLRGSGLSVTDTAAILGLSRGRISQLDKTERGKSATRIRKANTAATAGRAAAKAGRAAAVARPAAAKADRTAAVTGRAAVKVARTVAAGRAAGNADVKKKQGVSKKQAVSQTKLKAKQ